MTIRNLLFALAANATKSEFAQAQLGRLSYFVNYLRGLGSGGDVAASGETSLLDLLPPEATVFDVGANRGDYALAVLRTRPGAQLHCFEPSRSTFGLLSQALRNKNVVLNNCGLGEVEATMTLYSNGVGSGLASLSRRRLDHFGISMNFEEKVEITTLDNYCKKGRIDRIDLLKVDVEGHEMGVLKGAGTLFKNHQVKTLMFEFGGCNIDTRTYFQDFYYHLRDLGALSLQRIAPSGRLVEIRRYSEDLECFRTTNYVAHF
jgi:FkbM family methyltransferase